MPILNLTDEELRDPLKSDPVMRIEDADDCYGESCGQQYILEGGEALKPNAHSHLVITGRHPRTTPRAWPISKNPLW